MAEDAARALDELQGKDLKGRKMKLELALKDVKDAKEMKEVKRVGKEKETVKASKKVKGKEAEDDEDEEDDETQGVVKKNKSAISSSSSSTSAGSSSSGSNASSMRLVVFGIPEAVTKKLLKPAVCKISKKAQLDLLKDDDPMCESLLILTPGTTTTYH